MLRFHDSTYISHQKQNITQRDILKSNSQYTLHCLKYIIKGILVAKAIEFMTNVNKIEIDINIFSISNAVGNAQRKTDGNKFAVDHIYINYMYKHIVTKTQIICTDLAAPSIPQIRWLDR